MGSRGDCERDERREMGGYEAEVDRYDGDPPPVAFVPPPPKPEPVEASEWCTRHRLIGRGRCYGPIVDGVCLLCGAEPRRLR